MIHYIRISEETQDVRRSVQKKVTYAGKHKKHRCEGREKTWQAGQRGTHFAFRAISAAAKTALCLSGAAPLKPFEHTASSRTSYPSPCRKRQVSSTPSFVLSPKSHGFSGDPLVWLRVSAKRLGAWPLLAVMLLFLFLTALILAQHPVHVLLVEQQLAHLIARTPVFGIRRLFLR